MGKNSDAEKVAKLRQERDLARQERDEARAQVKALRLMSGEFKAGHFHSPVPDWEEAVRYLEQLESPTQLPGIDINSQGQLALLTTIATFATDLRSTRYNFDNPSFQKTDGLWAYGYLRALQPERIIEIGAGHTTLLFLDMMDRGEINCVLTCIEPNPQVLQSGLRPGDVDRFTLHVTPLQAVDSELFASLGSGDILFVDSSHISKLGSDVNRLIFDILPTLPCGAHVHFHDIFWPFEYPRAWVQKGRAWNEAYLLRAFLQQNDSFRIEQFPSYLQAVHPEEVTSALGDAGQGLAASIWLRKIR